MLSVEGEILIVCTRRCLTEADCDRIQAVCHRWRVDWYGLLLTAMVHKVAPLVYQNLRLCNGVVGLMPDRVRAGFASCIIHNSLRKRLIVEGLRALNEHFTAHSHEVMLIKAAALSHVLGTYYELTMSDDADVIVRPVREDAGKFDAMRTLRVIQDYHKIREHEIFEIDNRVHHDINMNGVISVDFEWIWCDSTFININGLKFCLPCIEDIFITSSINIIRKRFITLRSLFDIAELINEYPRLDWDEVARKAASYRCDRIVYSAVRAAQSVLGCKLSGAPLNALKPGAFRGRAIGFVCRGNSPHRFSFPLALSGESEALPSLENHPRRCPWSFILRFLSLSAGQYLRWYLYCKFVSSWGREYPRPRWARAITKFVKLKYYNALDGYS